MIYQSRLSSLKGCPFLPGRKCLGDDCGGWRHDPEEPELRIIEHNDPLAEVEPTKRPADVPASYEFWPCDTKEGTDACWFEPESKAERRRHGYCGFAGQWRFEG